MPHASLLRRAPSPPRHQSDEPGPSSTPSLPSVGEETLPPQDLRQLARDLHLAKLRVSNPSGCSVSHESPAGHPR